MLVGQRVQSPNFGTKIIVSPKAYRRRPIEQLEKTGHVVGYPWTMKESREFSEGFSRGASNCTMGFIKTLGVAKGYFFHSIPSNPFEKVEEAIIAAAEKLRGLSTAKEPQLEGILVGGKQASPKSVEQYTNLMELFDMLKIKYSALLGQKNIPEDHMRIADMHVSIPNDEYCVQMQDMGDKDLFDRKEVLLKGTGSKDGDRALLQEYFDVAKLRPEDPIELGE